MASSHPASGGAECESPGPSSNFNSKSIMPFLWEVDEERQSRSPNLPTNENVLESVKSQQDTV